MTNTPNAQNTNTAVPELSALEKGQILATRTIDIDRADLVRYAGASGDFNPIHWSESTARSVDLPGVIAHGMLSMGLAVDVVSQWCNNPGAIIDYQTRFTAMVPVADTTADTTDHTPGAQLAVTAKVGKVDEENSQVRVDLSVTNPNDDNAKVLTKAQALVQL